MKKTILGLTILLLIIIVPSSESRAAQLVDGIAAIVGSDIILLSEIKAREEIYKSRFSSKDKRTRGEILEELIDERLLRQEINRIGIDVDPQEMDQAIRSVLAQNRITLPDLKRELAAKGISWESYQRDLADRIKIMKFMRRNINSKINITEDDYELYRRRYPQKSKQQSKEEIEQAILELKSRDKLKSYIHGIRGRTYVEIKDIK